MRTTDPGRRSRLLALSLLLALPLAACSEGSGDQGSDDVVPRVLADLRWDIDDSLAESDPCGIWVVRTDLDEPLQIIDVPGDRVVIPEVTPPEGSEIEPGDRWLTSGGCVETAQGPVAVVETQAPYVDLSSAPPKLVAGFTPEGEQLWVREVPGVYLGGYRGRDAVVLDELGPEAGGWLVLDARTGETVAEGEGETREPTITLTRDLAVTLSDGVVPLPDGPALFAEGTVAQVDGDRLLVAAGFGVRLVDVEGAAPVWTYADSSLTALWVDAADLSTGIAVLRGSERAIVGVDLETGQQVWTSDVATLEVNSVDPVIGSGVLVVRDAEDLDRQVVIDTATGQRLPEPDGTLVVGQEVLLLVDEEGVPRPVTVDDLK